MRNKYCGNINIIHLNKLVTLCGWVHKIRIFNHFIFIDLRDLTGIIQIIFEKNNSLLFNQAKKLRNEYCIKIVGKVKKRDEKNNNKKLKTGQLEILAYELKIFNISKSIPLNVLEKNTKDISLKYRYLEIRLLNILKNIKLRSEITDIIRSFMKKNNFLDVETPILTKSTPEGARDYLVPSRNYHGFFYALPQSPQLFKQLLMIAGIDKYYQIVKCFRDEDLRSDRQPEFTQIDIEISFTTSSKVRRLIEKLIKHLWLKILNIHLCKFPVMSFDEAIKRYGSDKPDLRNPIEVIDITNILQEKKYLLFFNLTKKDNRIVLLCVQNKNFFSLKKINLYTDYAKKYGIENLFYIKIQNIALGYKGIQTSLKNILDDNTLNIILNKTHAKNGDILFLLASETHITNQVVSKLRLKLGNDLNITQKDLWKPIWIINFPMFKKDPQGNFSSMHHPFTAVKKNHIKILDKMPEKALSDSYDLIINGYEVGGGSVRIHEYKKQKQIFNILKIKKNIQKEKFGFLIEALQYGAPPHAGIALGLDRIIMLLTNSKHIRDVIAFPKTASATCPMTDSPSILDDIALKELGIKKIKKKNTF